MKKYDQTPKPNIDEVYNKRMDQYGTELYNKLAQYQHKKLQEEWHERDKYEKAKNITYFRYSYLGAGNHYDSDPELKKMRNYEWYRVPDKVVCGVNTDGTPRYRYVIILVGPGWGKTYGYTVAKCVQTLCLDRTKRILIVSKSAGRASEFMNTIQKILRFNTKIQRDFGGPFFSPNLKWNSERIEIRGSSKAEGFYSISNQGYYSQLEGARPHLIICDDPLDQQTAESVAGVQRFLRAFTSTVEPRLEPEGQLLFITHRFAPTDGLDTLLNSNYFKEDYGGKAIIVPAMDSQGHSTNPQRWPDVNIKKELVGRYVWETEYMQNAVSRGDCPFDLEWIAPPDPDIDIFKDRNRSKWVDIKPDYVDLTIDPSFTITEHSDYTGAVALGPHPTDKHGLIIMSMYAKRIASGFTSWYVNTLDLVGGKKLYVEIDGAGTLPDSFDSIGFHKYEVIHARRAKKVRIGDLEVCFKSQPGDKMERGRFRFYFHTSLLQQPSGLLDHNKVPIPVWKVFTDEFTSWNSESKTHEHLMDAIAGYCVKKRPWSRRMPIVISSSR